MAQADGVVANGTGSAVRSDINTQYAALWSNHSGSTEPSSGKVAYQFWADTNTSILKIRNSANNAWINLFTLAGGIDVDAASNFNEDVTFTGASYNLVWDKSDNALEFADNAKAAFGTGSDLQIYHDGSNSYIKDSGTGELRLSSNQFTVQNAASNETLLYAVENGAVGLKYDDSLKLETISSGAKVTGQLLMGTVNTALNFNKSTGATGLSLYMADDNDGYLEFEGGGSFYIRGGSRPIDIRAVDGEKSIEVNAHSSVDIYYDGSKKMETTSAGIKVTGTSVTFSAPDGGNRYFFGEMGDSASAQLSLYDSSDTQQVRISAGGANNEDSFFLSQKVTIGTTNGGDTSGIGIKLSGDDQVIPHATTTANTSTGGHSTWHFYNTNASYSGYRFYARIDGGIANYESNNVDLCDEREKKAIADAPSQLTTIKSWKIRNFRYNEQEDSEPLKIGVIAQEIELVNPELVGNDFKVRVDDSGNEILRKGVKEQQMMMMSIKALQEAIDKIETLETKVAALEAK